MLRSNFKKIPKSLLVVTFSTIFLLFFIFPLFSHAQQGYVPLAPLPGISDSGTSDLSSYLKNLFILGVSIATGLAVIMIVIGGIQYMSTDSISGKSDGREKIASALWGLLIALASYAILQTINPKLLNTTLDINSTSGAGSGAANNGALTSGTGGINGTGGTAGGAGSTAPGGVNFSDPSLYTGLNGSPIDSWYQDTSTHNMIFNYQDGSQVIQYWGNNGPTGQGEYYDSAGERIVNGKVVSYTTYSTDGTPTYYFSDGTSYTATN